MNYSWHTDKQMLYTMLFLILVTAWLVCGGENNGQSASAWWQSLTQADCSCRAHKDAFDLKVTKSPQTKAIPTKHLKFGGKDT